MISVGLRQGVGACNTIHDLAVSCYTHPHLAEAHPSLPELAY